MLKTLKKYKAPYLFILPFFILFFVFQLVPTIWTFYISFTDWKGIGDPQFSGLGNYKKMMVDNMFWESLGNTVVYWLTGLVFILFCALLIACLLNSRFLKSNSARAFFKTATFLPISAQRSLWDLFSACCLMKMLVYLMNCLPCLAAARSRGLQVPHILRSRSLC